MIHSESSICQVRWQFALLFAAVSIGCGKPAELPEVTIERARILMERDQTAEAVPLLNEAVAEMPVSAEARYQRGVAYESLGVLEKALVDYTECLRLDGERTDALNNKAVVLAKMKRFEDAAVEFGRLIDLDPQEALSWRNRGLCHADLGNYDAALADYAKALELAPNDPAGWFQRGGVYLKQGRFAEAEGDFTKAIEADPELAKAWMNRGVVRYRRGENKLAAEDLEKAQALDDNIVLPDVGFFDSPVSAAAGSDSRADLIWPGCRSAALKELTDRGFTDLTLGREFSSFLCAEFRGVLQGKSRTILVTCRLSAQDFVILPHMTKAADAAAVECSLLVLAPESSDSSRLAVLRFDEQWDPSATVSEPVLLRCRLDDTPHRQ